MRFFSFLFVLVVNLSAGILPEYDVRCDKMCFKEIEIDPTVDLDQVRYFVKKTPKIIHQIWFGDPSRLDKQKVEQWQKYAEEFGYQYFFWSERNDYAAKSFMNSKNYELMHSLRSSGNLWSASDVLRYELIKHFGGVYVDVDFLPPARGGKFVDLEEILSFYGLTLMTEKYCRNIGTSALFAANGLIICPPNHPVICALVEQVYDNATQWHSTVKECWPMFETGPFLLNKLLTGSFNIVPCHYLKKFGMYDWDW